MMGLDLGEVAENRRIILTGRPAMVPVDGDAAVALLEHGAGEGLDFGKADGRPAERVPGDGRGLDAGTDGQVAHHGRAVPGATSRLPGSVHAACSVQSDRKGVVSGKSVSVRVDLGGRTTT